MRTLFFTLSLLCSEVIHAAISGGVGGGTGGGGSATNAIADVYQGTTLVGSGLTSQTVTNGSNTIGHAALVGAGVKLWWDVDPALTNLLASNAVFAATNAALRASNGVTSLYGPQVASLSNKVDGLNGLATNLTVKSANGGPSLALVVETNAIVVTNGFVGIKTNTPAQALDVVGNVLVHGKQTNSGDFWPEANNTYNFGSASMHFTGVFGENVTANNTVFASVASINTRVLINDSVARFYAGSSSSGIIGVGRGADTPSGSLMASNLTLNGLVTGPSGGNIKDANGNYYVTNSTGIDGGAGGGEANVTGEISVTNDATYVFGITYDKSGVTNRLRALAAGWGLVGTNRSTNVILAVDPAVVASLAWANAVSNYVTASTNSASVTNWINGRQLASANLTNWSQIPTGAMANVVSTDFLTNWSGAISNLAQTKQAGSAVLSNLVGLADNNYTNVLNGGTNINIRRAGGSNFVDTTGQLNNWSQLSTNVIPLIPALVTNFVTLEAGALQPYGGSTVDGGRLAATALRWTNGAVAFDAYYFDADTNGVVTWSLWPGPDWAGFVSLDVEYIATNALNGASNVVHQLGVAPYSTNQMLGAFTYQTNKTERFWSSNTFQRASLSMVTLTNYVPGSPIEFAYSRLGTNTADEAAGGILLTKLRLGVVLTNWIGGFR